MKDPFRLKATAFLEKIGIELVLGDRVVSSSNGTVNSFDSIDRLFHHEITMNCSI
jgi:NADPH-dependent 2,4-dienoyl-CoA reductase/sulfur reductase-like enzyme